MIGTAAYKEMLYEELLMEYGLTILYLPIEEIVEKQKEFAKRCAAIENAPLPDIKSEHTHKWVFKRSVGAALHFNHAHEYYCETCLAQRRVNVF